MAVLLTTWYEINQLFSINESIIFAVNSIIIVFHKDSL